MRTPDVTTEGTIRTVVRVGYTAATLTQAQTFVAPGAQLAELAVSVARYGTAPPLVVTVSAEADPETQLAMVVVQPGVVATDFHQPTWLSAVFTPPVVTTPGATYRVTLGTETANARNFYYWSGDTGDPYPDGQLVGGSPRVDVGVRGYLVAEEAPPPPPPPTFDFAILGPAPETRGLPASGQVTLTQTLEVRLLAGTGRVVTFDEGPRPPGITAAPWPPCTPPATVTRLLSIAATAPVGLQTWTLTATAGDVEHATTVTLDLQAAPVEPPTPPPGEGPLVQGGLEWLATIPVGFARDVKRQGALLVVGTNTGLTCLDLSHPEHPVVRGALATGMAVNGLAIEGHLVYAVGGNRFVIVDVANPAAPTLVYGCTYSAANGYCGGLFRLSNGTGISYALQDVAVQDGIAFISTFVSTVHVIDCTTPAAPVKVRILGVPVVGSGNSLTPAQFAGLERLDEFRGGGALYGLSIRDTTLVVCEWKQGHMHAWDLRDPRTPVYRGGHASIYTNDVVTDGRWMYGIGTYASQSGLWSKKLPPMPPAPFDERATTMASAAPDAAFIRTYLWASNWGLNFGSLCVSESGGYVILAGGQSGGDRGMLEVLDVVNPGVPISVAQGRLSTGQGTGFAMAAAVGVVDHGDYLYVGAGAVGLQVYRFPGLNAPIVAKPLLRTLPGTGLAATGLPGGPFTPSHVTYTLENVGQEPLDWRAELSVPWLHVDLAAGHLPVDARATVTVSITDAADALPEGDYTGAVLFRNLSGSGLGTTTRTVTLTARPFTLMRVLPRKSEGTYRAIGAPGGPFAPTSMGYTVQNLGNEPMAWDVTVRNGSLWVQATPAAGVLAPGAIAPVTATLVDAIAAAQAGGGYDDALDFRNRTDDLFLAIDGTRTHGPTDRAMQLLVQDYGGSLFEGFGAVTQGGTGAPIYHVTTLADSGPGSLRDAISQDHRDIVFDVSGTILSTSDHLWCRAHQTITGAGQITIQGKGLVIRGTRGSHDVIVTGLRFRQGEIDCCTIDGGAFNVVIDHCSMHGANDGNLDIGVNGCRNVTLSWNLLHEPRGEGKNALNAYNPQDLTFHHNLYRGVQRNPQVRYDDNGGISPGTTVDMRNNLIAHTGVGTWMRFGVAANVVNNYYCIRSADILNTITLDGPSSRYYVVGNRSSLASYDPNLQSNWGRRVGATALSEPVGYAPVTTTDAYTAAMQILEHAGPRPLDAIDQALLDTVRPMVTA